MKVLQICSHFSIYYPGGITNYVRTLANSLSNLGVEVSIVSGGKDDFIDSIKIYKYKPISTRPYSLSYIENDNALDELLEFIKNNKFDIIHIHATGDLPMRFYNELIKLGIKYIVSLHDYYLICPRIFMIDKKENICHSINLEKCKKCVGIFESNDFIFRTTRKLKIKLPDTQSNTTEKRINTIIPFLNNASLLLPVSNKVKYIFEEICKTGKYNVLHIGNETADMEKAIQTKYNKIRLSFLGTLNKHKGEDVLEFILKKIDYKKFEVNFYGRCSKEVEMKFKNYSINFKGSYSPNELTSIMSHTDIGMVLPIWEDNAPQVVMEFLNFGIPLIATKRGGIPDFVFHTKNGYLFDPDSLDEKNKLINWLDILEINIIEEMKENIRKLKTPKEHCLELFKIYNDIVNEN